MLWLIHIRYIDKMDINEKNTKYGRKNGIHPELQNNVRYKTYFQDFYQEYATEKHLADRRKYIMRKTWISNILLILVACVLPLAANAATLQLPSALKIIQAEAFLGDTCLDEVKLPETLERIESRAFANSSVQVINLPASLTYIADDAFDGTTLQTVHADAGTYAYQWAVQHGYLNHEEIYVTYQGTKILREVDFVATNDWTVSTSDSWITIGTESQDYSGYADRVIGENSANGENTVYILLANNPSMTKARTGHVVFACGDTIFDMPVYQRATKFEVTQNDNVLTITSNCWWTVETDCDWIKANRTKGTWENSVSLTIIDNPSTIEGRMGTVTLSADEVEGAVKTFVFSQEKNNSFTFVRQGGGYIHGSVWIKAKERWTATANDSWIRVGSIIDRDYLSPTYQAVAAGDGKGDEEIEVFFFLSNNPSTTEKRTGSIIFSCGTAIYEFTIVQNPSYLTASRENNKIDISSNSIWKAETDVDWLHLSTNDGAWNGEIWLTMDENPSYTDSRTGHITISADGVEGAIVTIPITQEKNPTIHVTGISMEKTEYTSYIDSNYILNTAIYPENATNKQIKWSSSNPNIITVDEKSGQIRHKQTGTATLTATTVDGGFTASCIVTGVQPPTGIDINKQVLTLVVGSTEKLIKTVHPENVYRPDSVTWTSSNPSIATVDSTGKVTAISTGTANISVKTNDRGYTASCTVTVKPAIKVTGGTKRTGIVCRNIYITSDSAWTAETTDSWLTMYTTTDYSKRAKTMSGSAGTDVAAYVWLEELPLTIASRTGKITFRNAYSSYILDIVQDRTDAPMTGVSFKSTSGTLAAGETMMLIPTFEPSYATDRRVTWSSNNTAVATVDANGNVKGIAPGTANITVRTTDGGFTAEYTVVVNLEIIGGSKNEGIVCRSIWGTATSSWTATVDVSWIKINSVYDLNSASSTISGNATSELTCYAWLSELPLTVASRTGHIVFRCENSTYTLDIVQDRTDAPMTGVSFSPTSGTIAVGEMKTLIPTFAPSYATDRRVTWSSNNTAIATVDANGNVKGIAPGTAKITVKTTDGGFTATYTVTVIVPVTGVTLNKTTTTINKGNSETLIATVIPSNATNKKVEWTSSLLNTAEVDANGKVTAKNAGGCTITVTTDDGTYSARCVVTVVEPISFSPAFSNLNGNNYAITYLVNEYSHYAYSSNTFTGTQVEVMPSTELKLYAVGTNSNGETYAKIVYKGQTLYIPMWKVAGNWTGGAWTAQSAVSATYMYPGGGKAGSIDVGDTVYTLQENNGWRQVMYNISGGNWKIAWYQFSPSPSGSSGNYSVQNAVTYAQTWGGLKRNTATSGGPWCNYGAYGNDALDAGGDCANFVSQCLYAGGLQMNDSWYWYGIRNYSGSWTIAPQLREYLNSKFSGKNPTSVSDIDIGDIVWTYGDGKGDGYTYGHVMIVTGKSGNTIYIEDHSSTSSNNGNQNIAYQGTGSITWVVNMSR